ncbi:MAG: biotin--[acetyl-CoA-carboxylase] ligase [Thermoguttaceae bacterium]
MDLSRPTLDTGLLLRETFVAQIEYHRTIGSTNDRARQRAAARSGLLPLLIAADEQTAGRGRGSNRWWTGPGSLACTLLLDPRVFRIPPSRGPLVSLAAAVAVVETVGPLVFAHPVGLHWPNDVYAAGRKLAGILVEVLPQKYHAIGIGVNTNCTIGEAPEELRQTVVSIRDLTGTRHDQTALVRELLQRLEGLLQQLAADPPALAARAQRWCLQHGQILAVQQGRRTISGRCAGIASDGALILETPYGQRKVYSGVVKGPGRE